MTGIMTSTLTGFGPLVLLAATIVVAVLVARHTEAFRPVPVAAIPPAPSGRAARAARYRAALALLLGSITVGAGMMLAVRFPQTFGLPLLLAPCAGATVGLAAVSVLPVRTKEGPLTRRRADLTLRRPWSYGPGWAHTVPALSALAMIVFLVAAGLSSSRGADGYLRQIAFASGDRGSAAGPYPGWYYGAPLIAVIVLLAAATLVALGRIAGAPRRRSSSRSWRSRPA
jgi:hypothetical protein